MSIDDGIRDYTEGAAALADAMKERLGEDFFTTGGEDEAGLGLIDSPVFGRLVAFDIDGVIYALVPPTGGLIAIRQAGGGTEHARIAADGSFGAWSRQAPAAGAEWN